MMGRLKRKGMTNISFMRKQDPDLYLTCKRRYTSPSPTRTPHVTRSSNLYKEGLGSPKRDEKEETIPRARHKEPAYRRLPHDHNET